MTNTFTNALLAASLLASATLAYADEAVKAGGPTDRPGRTAEEEETVKAGGPTEQPGRTLEEEPYTAQSKRDKPGRSIDEDTVKSGGATDRPGRQVEGEPGTQQ